MVSRLRGNDEIGEAIANRPTTKRCANSNAIQLIATTRRLAQRNRWQRRDPRFIAALVATAAVALAALVWLAHDYSTSITDSITLALRFPVVIVVIGGWMAMGFSARVRRQSRRDAARSWLAALPLGEHAFAADARRRITRTVAVAIATVLLVVGAIGWMLALPDRSIVTLSLLLLLGATLGSVVGWSLARKDRRSARIRLSRVSADAKTEPFPLGHWPLRHSRAHADIALHARAIGALLLSIPVGVPASVIIAMVVFGLMALTVWDVSRALLASTRDAGAWLRSLPLNPHKATFELGARSVLAIVIAASMLVVAALALALRPTTAIVAIALIAATVAAGYVALASVVRPFGARR